MGDTLVWETTRGIDCRDPFINCRKKSEQTFQLFLATAQQQKIDVCGEMRLETGGAFAGAFDIVNKPPNSEKVYVQVRDGKNGRCCCCGGAGIGCHCLCGCVSLVLLAYQVLDAAQNGNALIYQRTAYFTLVVPSVPIAPAGERLCPSGVHGVSVSTADRHNSCRGA